MTTNKNMTDKRINIPQDLQQICKEIAAIAREKGMMYLSCKFTPNIDHEWREEISFYWKSGRHNEDAGKIEIVSTHMVNVTLNQ